MEHSVNSSTANQDESSTQVVLCCKEYGNDELSAGEQETSNKSSDIKTDDSLDKTNLEATETKDTSGTASARSGSTSPDLHCPICLGQLENRSYTDTCFHKFCFVCLVEWSKVRAVCPLCKQPFTSVIHSVRSYDDFEQLPITGNDASRASSLSANHGQNRFRYRTTVVDGSSLRRQRELESLQRPSRYRHRGASRFDTPPAFTSSFRRSIYRESLWVQTISGLNRYRDVSSGFFARNPACMHRLVPWLNRELMALLRVPHDVGFMLSVITDSIQQFDITSDFFYTLVSPFLGARTRHFIHEFNSFARSPFDMAAYDVRAVYARAPQTDNAETVAPIEFIDDIDSGESSSVSDNVEIINSESSQSALSTLNHSRTEKRARSHQFPISSSLHTQLVKNNSKVNPSSPIAGSSGTIELLHQVRTTTTNHSDDEVVVVAQDKPWRERSPIILSSSDDETQENLNMQLITKDSCKSDTMTEQLEQEVASSDDEPVLMSSVNSVEVQSLAMINDRARKHLMSSTINKKTYNSDSSKTSDLTEKNTSSSSSKRTDRSIKNDHMKEKHRNRHHHRRRRHSDHTDNSASSHLKPDASDGSSSLVMFDGNNKSGSSSTTSSVDVMIKQSEAGFIVSDSAPKINLRNSIRRRGKNEIWVSDSSSSDEGNSRAIRSAIVVPGMSQFKKHSSGHKNAELTTSS